MRCSAVVLAATLGAGLQAFAQVDQGLLNLVPAGTRILAGIQVTQGKVSPFGQYLLQQAQKQDPQFQKLLDDTGFDPRSDLQEVLFAANGGSAGTHSRPLIIARGSFDPQRVKAAVTAKGGQVETFQGVDILSGKQGDNGGVAFLDATLAVLGSRTVLHTLIQNRDTPTTLDPELAKRMEAVSSGNEAWFASIVPGTDIPAKADLNLNGQQINGAVLQGVLESSGGVHFASDALNINFDAVTRSDKDAQSLSDVIRFLAGMAQTQAQDQAQLALLAPSLNAMQLTTDGAATHVSLSIPEKTAEQLLAQSSNAKHGQ
ncbi:MAG: hypothetical protein WB676_29425 [Bryobacteraceae bacterium]